FQTNKIPDYTLAVTLSTFLVKIETNDHYYQVVGVMQESNDPTSLDDDRKIKDILYISEDSIFSTQTVQKNPIQDSIVIPFSLPVTVSPESPGSLNVLYNCYQRAKTETSTQGPNAGTAQASSSGKTRLLVYGSVSDH